MAHSVLTQLKLIVVHTGSALRDTHPELYWHAVKHTYSYDIKFLVFPT